VYWQPLQDARIGALQRAGLVPDRFQGCDKDRAAVRPRRRRACSPVRLPVT